ncbi:hypothetical protein [Haloarcula amylovorans]|uniref:hypothetical protein n=1 Tax=Haloarcula amylovorans TaxID=2562280 RepID=UPI0010762E6B|nr:hypothetical protein [Halomicroarcula amylolytica]
MVSDWLPDSPPTWDDVIVTVLAVVWLSLTFSGLDTISWTALAAGIGIVVVVAGPVAHSTLSERISARVPALGPAGRAVGIVLFAVAVWFVAPMVDVPAHLVTSFCGGGMLALAVLVALQAVYAGEVSGWRIGQRDD